jgi:hypothetical protein
MPWRALQINPAGRQQASRVLLAGAVGMPGSAHAQLEAVDVRLDGVHWDAACNGARCKQGGVKERQAGCQLVSEAGIKLSMYAWMVSTGMPHAMARAAGKAE